MTTATRTRHLRTCHCHDCEATRAKRKKQRALNLHRGIPNRVDATRTRKHIGQLRQTMGWPSIAAASGSTPCYLRRIGRGEVACINRETERKILAVRPAQQHDGGLYIDATGTVRRIRALMAAGHPQYAIAAAAKSTQYRISRASHGVKRVRAMFADKITAAYQQLSSTEGTSARARSIAKANAWADPTWWEDWGGIDDPKAPEAEPPQCRDDYVEDRHRADEVAFLSSCGISTEEIAARLSTPDSPVSAKRVGDILSARRRAAQKRAAQATQQKAAAQPATPSLTGEIGELEVAA